MSVDFQAITQLLRADPTTDSINHDAYTVTMRVYMTTDSASTNNILNVQTDDSQMHQLYTDGNNTSWKVGHNLKTTSATLGTGNTGEWISIALVGAVNGASQKVLRGYLRNAGGATQSVEHVHGHQTADELSMVLLNGWNYNNAANGLCKVADFKMWSSALTQAQIEAEWDSSTPVITSGLICHNDFGGANIGEALSSTTSNQAGFDTWVSTDSSGNASAVDPVWSSDNPTYAAAGVTLSGTVAMPDTVPTTGIAVEQPAIGSIEDTAAYVEATFGTVPTTGRTLIAFVGGWMSSSTGITLSDNRDGTWEQLGLTKRTGSSFWVGAWRSTMPAGTTAAMTVRATPNVASGNWLTLQVNEIKDAYAYNLADVALTFDEGSSAAPAVDLASTTNGNTLVMGAVSYLSNQNAATAATNWTTVAKKDGAAALSVIRRNGSSAGNYDPTWALTNSDSWIACGLALTEDPPDTAAVATVSPAAPSVEVDDTQQFSATVGDFDAFATWTWTIESGDGSIDQDGLYTAPATSGSATIRATLDQDVSLYDEASVTITESAATTTVATTWREEDGTLFASESLDYVCKSSTNAVITTGTGTTSVAGVLTVTIPATYSGQKILVQVENVGSDMLTSGKFHGTAVATAA